MSQRTTTIFAPSQTLALLLGLTTALLPTALFAAEIELDLRTGRYASSDTGVVSALKLTSDDKTPEASGVSFGLTLTTGETLSPTSIRRDGDHLAVSYAPDWSMDFQIKEDHGFALLELTASRLPENLEELHLFQIALPETAVVEPVLNAGFTDSATIALMAAEPNIHAFQESPRSVSADRGGCSHHFEQHKEAARQGQFGIRFGATADARPGGWAMQGRRWSPSLDLTGCEAIRIWVHGDGKGQMLKVQLLDSSGGHRDVYVKIDFEGWQQLTLGKPSSDILDYTKVSALNLYYNSMPAGQSVQCDIDQIEAMIRKDGKVTNIVLEDFERRGLPDWISPTRTLNLKTYARHGLTPLRFGVLAAPPDELLQTIERFEKLAGMPSPEFHGTWMKRSPQVKNSYFFLTSFTPAQFDDAVKIARHGGFDTILLGQSSWCSSTGHYEPDRKHYPAGLPDLVKIVKRFKDAGFRVGLHVLGASLYYPDPYLTPIPDQRLVKDLHIPLAADIDAKSDFIPTTGPPVGFPKEDGGYQGNGVDLHLGDELIRYQSVSLKEPYGFLGCRRGQFGTTATAHAKGTVIDHLQRSFGYLMYDLDSSLADEVTTNFAKVANACDVDMVYFDGSERLQGDHWYYNARLIKSFYDKLADKNTLVQASSMSHYSWHILARSASADGHDDLKAYLDERSPAFHSFERRGMPLDIGWYYGYEARTTPDMFEYILGATIGYDSSLSFQVSVEAAAKNPFTDDYLDMIQRFEKLRHSGRVDTAMRQRLRIDPRLGGLQDPEQREKLRHLRQEYRLLGAEGKEIFQRVAYDPWHTVDELDGQANQWSTRVETDSTKIGVQFHALPGAWLQAGASWHSPEAILLEGFDDLNGFHKPTENNTAVKLIETGQNGSVSSGVSHSLKIYENDVPEGDHYALYRAHSNKPTADGWSMMHRALPREIDLSHHAGIGLWMRGDGKGGKFKLQLHDGKTALDFYINNDYTGWRYQQLPWPPEKTLDLSKTRSFAIYYNGLPGNETVACGIAGIKAIPAIDDPTIVDPYVEIGSQRFEWKGVLQQGEYVFLWPGEPVSHYQRDHTQPTATSTTAPLLRLAKGPHTVRFGCAGRLNTEVRVRLTSQNEERHPLAAP